LSNRLLIVGVILCIATLTFAGFSQAQSIVSGVKPGMAFYYTVSGHWSSNDPYSSIPPDFLVLNQTSWIEVRISAVTGADVSTVILCYFNDGTTDIERGSANLCTGVGSGFVSIIGANLSMGDRIHPDGNDVLTVLGTSTRYYDDRARVVNYVRIIDDNQTGGYIGTRDLYFDKETGILIEQIDQVETTTSPYTVSRVTWKIAHVSGVDNWVIPGFTFPTAASTSEPETRFPAKFYPLAITVLLLVIVVLAIIIIYKKKLAKPNN
jgi:hypothetical protein